MRRDKTRLTVQSTPLPLSPSNIAHRRQLCDRYSIAGGELERSGSKHFGQEQPWKVVGCKHVCCIHALHPSEWRGGPTQVPFH